MTRTTESHAPKALERDRHLNKTGVSGDLKKGGCGSHNWGNPEHDPEYVLDESALEIGDRDNTTEKEKKAPQPPKEISLEELPIKKEKPRRASHGQS